VSKGVVWKPAAKLCKDTELQNLRKLLFLFKIKPKGRKELKHEEKENSKREEQLARGLGQEGK